MANDACVSHILVVIAMEAEAQPLLSALNLTQIDSSVPNAPGLLFSGNYGENDVFRISVAVNGKSDQFKVDNVGTVPAGLCTFLAVNQLNPDLVINAGTAGGFSSKGAAIGDAFISTAIKNHDRRIPIPGFTEYGIGNHSSLPCPNMVEVQF